MANPRGLYSPCMAAPRLLLASLLMLKSRFLVCLFGLVFVFDK